MERDLSPNGSLTQGPTGNDPTEPSVPIEPSILSPNKALGLISFALKDGAKTKDAAPVKGPTEPHSPNND